MGVVLTVGSLFSGIGGSQNHMWKGANASAMHYRMTSLFGQPKRCEVCGALQIGVERMIGQISLAIMATSRITVECADPVTGSATTRSPVSQERQPAMASRTLTVGSLFAGI